MGSRLQPHLVERKIRDIIAEATGGRVRAQDLSAEQTLAGHLGLTSLAVVAMIFQFEEVFGIDASGLALDPEMFRTVGSVVEKGRELVSAQDTRGAQTLRT